MIAPFGTKRANFGHSDKKVGVCYCLLIQLRLRPSLPASAAKMASTSGSNITPAARMFGFGMASLYQTQPQPVRLAVWITQGGLRTSEVLETSKFTTL